MLIFEDSVRRLKPGVSMERDFLGVPLRGLCEVSVLTILEGELWEMSVILTIVCLGGGEFLRFEKNAFFWS